VTPGSLEDLGVFFGRQETALSSWAVATRRLAVGSVKMSFPRTGAALAA